MGYLTLGRDQGYVTEEEIRYLDEDIIEAIHPKLIARQVFPVKRTGGGGANFFIKSYTQHGIGRATLSMYGDSQRDDKPYFEDGNLKIPCLSSTFMIRWRDLLASRQVGLGLDVQSVKEAAVVIAEEEDKLCLTGDTPAWPQLGIEGLATATGRLTQPATAGPTSWPTNAIADINAARAQLQAQGFTGVDFIMILTPAWAKVLDRQIANTTITYRTFLLQNKLLAAVLESPFLYAFDDGQDNAVVCVPDAMNFDLIEEMPIKSMNWEYKDGNNYAFVRECVVPRVKRPTSICEITGIT